jgi:hypothetical protein
MIRIENVRERLLKTPFEPFRICMTNGRTYDITPSELCLRGRTKVHVTVPDPKMKRAVMRVDPCAWVHVVRFEPLNGKERRPVRARKRK